LRVDSLTPMLRTWDLKGTIEFYKSVLGFETEAHEPDWGWARMALGPIAVMFSGRAHADSPELISSGRMVELCKDLSNRYPDRIIVIDTPPVLASSEPATLASYVHQLIMVVAADQTDRHQLRKSLESVASCKNISLLFNKAPRWNEAEYTPYYGYATTANAAPPAPSS